MRKQELDDIWTKLDREDQDLLLEFAYKLQDRLVLKGGPYDGLRLDPMCQWNLWVNVKHDDGVVAVYVDKDGDCQVYVFARLQKTGEGCMPDVYPNEVTS